MQTFLAYLEIPIFGNTIYRYMTAAALCVVFLLALWLLEKIIIRKLKAVCSGGAFKRGAVCVDFLQNNAVPLLYAGAIYFAMMQLQLEPGPARFLYAVWIIVLAYQVTRFSVSTLVYLLQDVWLKKETQTPQRQAFKSIITILRIVLWGVGIVFVLDNLGFNVAAVVAGLGIGGIAIALAAQTILGDLFNYFVIFFDRPFEEGDFVVFDDYLGVIENIGIKSTRIRSLSGEQIVISNSNLTGSRIRNYKRMSERRILFKLGIVYDTPLEKVKKIPDMIRKIIEKMPNTRCDRAHFKEFGDYSLNFEMVYYVISPDYNKYMDIQQAINLEIFQAFKDEAIEFAYPTSVELQKSLDLPK